MSQSSAGNRPLEADWESHKNTIQHLYVSEDNPLNQVRDVMRKSHNFEARYDTRGTPSNSQPKTFSANPNTSDISRNGGFAKI